MNKKGFTLVELLAVIVILAIILAIAIPGISGIISSAAKNAFASDAKMILKAVDYKKLEDDTFDVTSINKDNLGTLFGLSNDNYNSVNVTIEDDIPIISIVGKNKWDGMIACGTYKNMRIVQSASDCGSDVIPPTVVFNPNGNTTYAKSRKVTVNVTDDSGISTLKYVWTHSTTIPDVSTFTTSFNSGDSINTLSNVTGGYYLWVLAVDIMNNQTITSSNVFNIDNSGPIITIIGSNPVEIIKGGTYTDTGATATDDVDGNLTSAIQTTSNVNPNIVGTYTVTYSVTDSNDNTTTASRTVNVAEDLSGPGYIASKGVNGPVLSTGMTPIKWNGTTWVATTKTDPNWYNYTITDKKWANVQTTDGSMWVWIPRYVYRINSGWHTSTAGSIDVQFSMGLDDTRSSTVSVVNTGNASDSNGTWTNHAAFTFGSTQLTGIWIAKFKASGTLNAVDIKPNVAAIYSCTLSDMFTASRNMEVNNRYGWGTSGTGIDTHLIKNVEWGSAVYLAQSPYGKNAEVWPNANWNYITGCGTSSITAAASGDCYTYDTSNGQQASTTGNVYGIYDMSGGTWEYTAAYANNGNSALTTYGSSLVNATSQYKDLYTVTSDGPSPNYTNASAKKGDAIYETSSSYDGTTSWYGDYSYMPYYTAPVFVRGGLNNQGAAAGLFYFLRYDGSGGLESFRVVLLVNSGL